MKPLPGKTQAVVAVAVGISVICAVWLMFVPGVISLSTYAALAAVFVGFAAVTLISARNAQPTRTVTHLLTDTESASRPRMPSSR